MSKIKETTKVVKFKLDKDNIEMTEEYYPIDALDKLLGEINRKIYDFEKTLYSKPMFVVISRQIEILFRRRYDLINFTSVTMMNNEPIYVYSIFGINCIVSKKLDGLEFELI